MVLEPLGEDCDDADGRVAVAIEAYVDADADGFGSATLVTVCVPPIPSPQLPLGFAATSGDCDDSNAAARPGLVKLPEPSSAPVDNDCSGTAESTVDEIQGSGTPVIYVDPATTNATEDGSKDAPIKYLADPLAVASPGTLFVLATGDYDAGFDITADFHFTGGFDPTNAWSQSNDPTATRLFRNAGNADASQPQTLRVAATVPITFHNLTLAQPALDASAEAARTVLVDSGGRLNLVDTRIEGPQLSASTALDARGIDVHANGRLWVIRSHITGARAEFLSTPIVLDPVQAFGIRSQGGPVRLVRSTIDNIFAGGFQQGPVYASGLEISPGNAWVLESEVDAIIAESPRASGGSIQARGISCNGVFQCWITASRVKDVYAAWLGTADTSNRDVRALGVYLSGDHVENRTTRKLGRFGK